jgi:hypothetical protein
MPFNMSQNTALHSVNAEIPRQQLQELRFLQSRADGIMGNWWSAEKLPPLKLIFITSRKHRV